VRANESFEVTLRYRGAGRARAISARLAWDPAVAAWEGVEPGALLAGAGGVAFSPRPGTVDAAVLGAAGDGLAGGGDLVVVRLRALKDGPPGVSLASADARDRDNRPVALGDAALAPPAAPGATTLGVIFPNPFRGELHIAYTLARGGYVKISVYDLAGRVVRRVEDGPRPAGFHVNVWDGRADGGRAAPPGMYLVRFEAGEVEQTRRVQLVR
jgi:hypothetical protein